MGLESQLSVEGITGIERIWVFNRAEDGNLPAGDAMLIVSFAASTAVFDVGTEITQVEVPAAFAGEPTLACQMNDGGLVQVTPSGFMIWDIKDRRLTPDTKMMCADNKTIPADVLEEVVAAAFANSYILIAQRNGMFKQYCCGTGGLERIGESQPGREASAIAFHIEPYDVSSGASDAVGDSKPGSGEGVIAAAYFDGTIAVFRSADMWRNDPAPLGKTRERAHAVSLKFYSDESGTLRLMAGLADGTLVSYDTDDFGLKSDLTKGRTQSALGSRPLVIADLEIKSERFEERVIAAGISDRLSLVFESRGHLEFSASGKKVSQHCAW